MSSPRIQKFRSQAEKILGELDHDYVVRDDKVVQAFRDIYSAENDDDDDGSDVNATISEDNVLKNGIAFEGTSLSNSSSAHSCKRTKELLNVYDGAVASFNFLHTKGEKTKKGFETYLSEEARAFVEMEVDIRNKSIVHNFDEDEEDDAMFFVNKAKQGIAKRKTGLGKKYEVIDKTNLQTWRKYVGEVTSQQDMDVAAFLDVMATATKETAKRMQIPTDSNLEKSLHTADGIMRKLLGNDVATLSSKKSSVGELEKAASGIRQIAQHNRC